MTDKELILEYLKTGINVSQEWIDESKDLNKASFKGYQLALKSTIDFIKQLDD